MIPAGVRQGAKMGSWLLVIMINDLRVTNADLWKYVDETTIFESIPKRDNIRLQESVDELIRNSTAHKFQLNQEKCKELRITFTRSERCFSRAYINGLPIEVVSNVKMQALRISKLLKWHANISHIMKKISTTLYFLCQLKRAGIHASDLLAFYKTCVRPVM